LAVVVVFIVGGVAVAVGYFYCFAVGVGFGGLGYAFWGCYG